MVNPYALPTLGAMLLFWTLGAYVLTRSPRSAISLTAVAAQLATAAYLLGQGMAANARTEAEWIGWVRHLQWGTVLAPVLWYALTVLLLREQPSASRGRYLRVVALPLGALLVVAAVILLASIYSGDSLYAWSKLVPLPAARASYSQFKVPIGALYSGLVAFIAVSTLGAMANVLAALRLPLEPQRRRCFRWLLAAAALFTLGANALTIAALTDAPLEPWVPHLVLAGAMVAMAWNVAAYSLLFKRQVIRTDFLYFLSAMGIVIVLYWLLFVFSGVGYSFALLGLTVVTLMLVIVSHALVDVARQALDRVFFGSDVRQLRANLASTIQSAALTESLPVVLAEARAEIDEVSTANLVRLTEQALRRLNNPAALAECALQERIPAVMAAALGADPLEAEAYSRLERARALRAEIASAIERLKPPEADAIRTPAAIQYSILRDEYLLGLLNKQIMARYSLSEGTFHRNRRLAIEALAQELESRERRLAQPKVPSA